MPQPEDTNTPLDTRVEGAVNPGDPCPAGQSGSLPHPSDCGQYLVCNIEIMIAQPCSLGLQFNAAAG